MAIEKGLYSAPMGLTEEFELDDSAAEEGTELAIEIISAAEEGTELAIEIIDPEAVILDDGSVEITLIPDADEFDLLGFDANLAEGLDEGELRELSGDLIGLVEADIESLGRHLCKRFGHVRVKVRRTYRSLGRCLWSTLGSLSRSGDPVPSRDYERDIPRRWPSPR
jgi:hypothetical protein